MVSRAARDMADDIRAFMRSNEASLTTKT